MKTDVPDVNDDSIQNALDAATSTMINHQALCLAIADEKNYKLEKYKKQVMDQMKKGQVKENGEPFVHNSYSIQLGH